MISHPIVKCPNNTINFVKFFNGKIEELRYKPMFTLLEELRKKFIKTTAMRFKIAKFWPSMVVPKVKL